nr:hypothetical protein [Kiritimatiellia bacterium]
WMLAGDVMVPIQDILRPHTPLEEALSLMAHMDAEETILRDPDTHAPIGLFDLRSAKRSVSRKLLQMQGA